MRLAPIFCPYSGLANGLRFGYTQDADTGEVAIKEVVETYVNETDKLVHVFVGGEEIIATPTNSGNITPQDWVAGTCDAIMDGLFSTIAYFYNPFSTDFVKTTFNAIVDGLTDIAENWLFNSTTPETAQSSFVPSSTLRRPIRTKRSQHSAFEQICLLY